MKEKLKLYKSLPLAISNKAFSLIEGVIAITILVIAILSIIGILSLGLRILQTNEEKSHSLLQDQADLEEILSLPYDQINAPEIEPGLKKIEIGKLKTYKTK